MKRGRTVKKTCGSKLLAIALAVTVAVTYIPLMPVQAAAATDGGTTAASES